MNGAVRQERTGWRDAGLSARHRRWGFDCPIVDLDFLVLNYDTGKAVAVVEYKQEHAAVQHSSHPSYQAIIGLGNDAGLAVFAVRYAADYSWYRVTPLNAKAREWVPEKTEMIEEVWVDLLYKIRGRPTPPFIWDAIEL